MEPKMTPHENHYRNFRVALYARVYEVQQMRDLDWLSERFAVMRRSVKFDKVYLETHRDTVVAEEATLRQARRFFEGQGLQVSGGITLTVDERNRFQTYCYTNPQHRQQVKEVVAYTARLFDELILDDFFFTNCKCASCIRARGTRSWTAFRLDLMAEAARSLVVEPARAANPRVELVIKYPNWYEHFQGLGFNLEAEPPLFDRLYTGTETRDPLDGNQHLQPYHGYAIFRYFENVKPGANGGGWVDTGGMNTADRYAEQLWLTLFAKAPEVTLFDFRQLQRPLHLSDRAPWQGSGSSFDFDAAVQPARLPGGELVADATVALAAGYAFEQADGFLGELGRPLGVPAYKPRHAAGEDFLHSYLGMLGIPIELLPEFPTQAPLVFLAESAAADPGLIGKIERQLQAGKQVVITSGLLKALQEAARPGQPSLDEIVELRYTGRKVLVETFQIGWNRRFAASRPVLLPQIQYLTNDSWEEISGLGPYSGYPLLLSAGYAGGQLFVLTIPENFSDLYALPREVLGRVRETLTATMDVRLEAPGQVALFVYDNSRLIVESFLPEAVEVQLLTGEGCRQLHDLVSGERLDPAPQTAPDRGFAWQGPAKAQNAFPFTLAPHSFRVFRVA
jgi:hypothetical protein